ncbi:MAG: hypothetical protein JSV39_03145 [Candidatus Aenigmatarchaeota archaeon]|nr:MAG: hypothetical protein JSV39_03145 [Candidatus Aenigmarchaeota archaeon]
MRLSLELIVIAVVILVVAVVILAFFALGVQQANQLTDARNQCINIASASCNALNVMPPSWSISTIRIKDEVLSCEMLTGKTRCTDFGVTPEETTAPADITTTTGCTGNGFSCEEACTAPKMKKGTCGDNADPKKKVCCG